MKVMTRKMVCKASLLCLVAAQGSHLLAQKNQRESAAAILEQPPSAAAPSTPIPPALTSDSQIRLGPGDLLEVRVFDVPELTQAVRVNDLGDASFNLIGVLHMSSLTPDEARDTIARKLVDGHFLVNPQVSVLIQEYGTQGVSVLGEVQKPGVYSVLGNRTLLDVISQAGGTTVYAGASVTIKRRSDGKLLAVPLTKNASATLSSDVRLEPGDKVVVPRASLVYVLGDVGRPGGFLMQNGGHMTVLQAVALAGGQTRTASLNKARLIHKTGSGYTDTPIALKQILNGHEPDKELEAEDILFVPNSAAKSAIYRTVPGIVQSAGSAAVYGAIF